VFVKQFYPPSDKREGLIAQAEKAAQALTKEWEKTSADMYIKTMKKIIEKGESLVDSEIERLEKLRSGKLSDKKKEQLTDRLNILGSFSVSRVQAGIKDEL